MAKLVEQLYVVVACQKVTRLIVVVVLGIFLSGLVKISSYLNGHMS